MKKYRIDFFATVLGGWIKRLYLEFENEAEAKAWALENMPAGSVVAEVNLVKQ